QIKNGAVTGKKLHKNAVTSKKVKDHSLKKKDLGFNPTGPKGATGPQGPQGVAGPTGPAGSGNTAVFNSRLTNNQTKAVSFGSFTVAAATDGTGACDGAVLVGHGKPYQFRHATTYGFTALTSAGADATQVLYTG